MESTSIILSTIPFILIFAMLKMDSIGMHRIATGKFLKIVESEPGIPVLVKKQPWSRNFVYLISYRGITLVTITNIQLDIPESSLLIQSF